MNKPTHSHTHCQVAQSRLHKPKLGNKYVLPTLKERANKILKNNEEIIKHESTTKAIRNAGKVLNMNIVTINKISGKLKINRFKIPHYA